MRSGWCFLMFVTGCLGPSGMDEEGGKEACHDLVDTYADRCAECGLSTQEDCAADFEDAIDGCERVVGLDDHDEFYDECLPSFTQISCDEMVAGTWQLAPSCENQLLVENE